MKEITPALRTEGVKYAIRDIVLLAQELKRKNIEVLHLNVGDPIKFDFETPPHIIDSVCAAMKKGFNGYGPSLGINEAVDAIKSDAQGRGIKNICTIFICAGVSEGIELALAALLNRGENLLIPYPCYPLYPAVLAKLEAEQNPYYLDEDKGWEPDLKDIEGKINKKTRGIVIINPNNPTGAVYSQETLRKIIELARRYNLMVFSDEIYNDIVYDNKKSISIASLNPDMPVMTFGGMSKVYLAPGWRLAWGILSGETETIKKYDQALQKLLRARLCANHPEQFAIRPALQGDRSHLVSMMERLHRRRDITFQRLNSIKHISCVKPEGAFYAFPRLDIPISDEEFVKELLYETKVLVVHGGGFGERPGTKHIRVVFLAPEEVLNKAFDLLEGFMEKHF